MSPNDKVLVYQHRAEKTPVVANGLAVIKLSELNTILQQSRCYRLAVPTHKV